MSLPALIYLALSCLGIGVAIAKDGQPKDEEYSAVKTVIATCLVCGLLYWGGFFDAQ